MRIFLTGGQGLVGRNIKNHPLALNYKIFSPSHQELDLRNYAMVDAWIKNHKPDLIIHAAGKVGGIQANIANPLTFFLDNLDMGRNVVQAARRNGIQRFINLGSSCIYPRNATNPLKEEMLLKGELEPTNEGYALAKISIIKLCEYIAHESNDFLYKTLIPCNIYGRFDNFDPMRSHMIPAIIHKLHQSHIMGLNKVEIWGDGQARREFMYAEDLASCIWRAVEKYETLPILMNVGVGQDYTVLEYYQKIAHIIGFKGSFSFNLSKPVGMRQKMVSIEKSLAWGWKAQTSQETGITETYKYYLEECLA